VSNEYTPIDVNRSLVPLNPEAVSESVTYDPRTRANPIPYSGKNILPTDLGYTSFFGLGNTIGASTLLNDVQEILSYRTLTGDTLLFALCRDGCYFRALAGDGTPTLTSVAAAPPEPEKIKVDLAADELASWTFLFNSPQGSTSPWHLWTQALLENELYLYQKGMKFIARISSTEKGQFFVEKLLPGYIINGANKIYRYVAALTIQDPSAFTSRKITYRGIDVSIPTTNSLLDSVAHGGLVGKLLSAGIGASLQNYNGGYKSLAARIINYTPTLNHTAPKIYRACFISQDINQSTFQTGVWGGNLNITIRGTLFTVTPNSDANTWERAKYLADQINLLGPAGVHAIPMTGRGISADGSSYSVFVLIEEIAGDTSASMTQSGNNPTFTLSLANVKYNVDIDNYKYAYFLNILITNPDLTVGNVIQYADSIVNFSYTVQTGDTQDIVHAKLKRAFIAAGYQIISAENNINNNFSVAVIPAKTLWIDFINPTYAITTKGFTVKLEYSTFSFDAAIEKVPGVSSIQITHNGGINDILVTRQLHSSLDRSQVAQYYYLMRMHNTGGTIVFKLRDVSIPNNFVNPSPLGTGAEEYTFTYSAWNTLSEAFSVYADFKAWSEGIPGFTFRLDSSPSPIAPTSDFTFQVNVYRGQHSYATVNGFILYIPTVSAIFNSTEELVYTANTGVAAHTYMQLVNVGYKFRFEKAAADVNGVAMQINIAGQIANITWNYSDVATNANAIKAAIEAMTNRVGSVTISLQNSTTIEITATFNGPHSNSTHAISLVNCRVILITGVNFVAITPPLLQTYPPIYENIDLLIRRTLNLSQITVTVGAQSVVKYIAATDTNKIVYDKILEALNTIAIKYQALYYMQSDIIKYSGDIVFSIAAFDGIDPVVSVGPTSADEPFTITSATNETIELAQVEGISASRGRLLAWDYTNTLYLGSAVDPTDFTPSITTQANSYRVDAIKGNIVLILPHPEGAVIYSTGNIVKSTYQGGGSQQVFSYRAINEKGAIDPRHIAKGSDSHYLIGSEGLYTVDYSKNEVSLIGKELTDFLKRYKFPIQLQMIGNRYLVVNLLEAPPTVDAKAWREGSATAYQLGEGTRTARPVQVLSIPDVPFGQNLFPLFTNAMIYDAVLDKWGYATLDYKHLFSINPTNQEGYPAEKDYALREAAFYNDVRSLAALLPDGSTVLLNDSPDSSYIVYGKYLLSRSHYTRVLKVEAQFLDYPDCTISLEPSMDGRLIDYDNIKESAAIGTPGFRWPIMAVARWFNILVKGKFNLTGLSIEGKRDGRRP